MDIHPMDIFPMRPSLSHMYIKKSLRRPGAPMLFLCHQSPFTAEMMENSLLLVFLQPKQIPGFLHMRKQKPLDYRRDERVEEEEEKKRQDLSITCPCLTTQEEIVVASLQATLEKKSNNTSSSSRKIHSMAPIQDLLQPPTAMDQPRNNSPLRRSEIFQELQAIPLPLNLLSATSTVRISPFVSSLVCEFCGILE